MLYLASRPKLQHALKTGAASFHCGIPALTFYTRSYQVEELSRRLNNRPGFSFFLGPPSSGKTALAQ
ncbi:hypothetical protein PGTUg99_027724 [Puccinia graminis f. sp. tritici]|uniref:Uncharacterized protein n=1 Tax=Puccinia graminis f. sp. tritici TaxID=56615 RepID=A0A5B0QLV5_PUCGR|nr:hypothetical protein PGTUg99_027724 [Puccinia graminis f. sp. tritici]